MAAATAATVGTAAAGTAAMTPTTNDSGRRRGLGWLWLPLLAFAGLFALGALWWVNRDDDSSDLRAEAQAALADADLEDVGVRVDGDTVVLEGNVEDQADIDAAAQAVLGIDGINDVDNQLQIDGSATPVAPATTAPPQTSTAPASTAPATTAPASTAPATTAPASTVPATTVAPPPPPPPPEPEPEPEPEEQLDPADGSTGNTGLPDDIIAGILAFQAEQPIDDFAEGTDTVTDAQAAELDGLAELLVEDPAIQVEVIGHTCSLGDAAKNQDLSERRASMVAAYLIDQGVAASQLLLSGAGESQLLVDDTAGGDPALNRRVEINLVE